MIKYLQKKIISFNEIHEGMLQTLAEDCPSYATVTNSAAQKIILGEVVQNLVFFVSFRKK